MACRDKGLYFVLICVSMVTPDTLTVVERINLNRPTPSCRYFNWLLPITPSISVHLPYLPLFLSSLCVADRDGKRKYNGGVYSVLAPCLNVIFLNLVTMGRGIP
jgi:hypothetical protein